MLVDKKKLSNSLKKTFDTFIESISKFDRQEINHQRNMGEWTAGQVADHVIKATGGLPDSHVEKSVREVDLYVESLQDIFLNFEIKMESPDFIYPENGPFNRDELITDLELNKQRYVDIIQNEDLRVVCLDFEFPTYGFLTRYEWLMFIQFHTQRHNHQLMQIFKGL